MPTVNMLSGYYLRAAPHWSKRGGVVIARMPPNPLNHRGTRLAAANLAEAAYDAYGQTGFVGRLPAVAAAVRAATSGHTTVPGGSAARREQSRQARHAATPAVIAALRGGARQPAAAGMASDFY